MICQPNTDSSRRGKHETHEVACVSDDSRDALVPCAGYGGAGGFTGRMPDSDRYLHDPSVVLLADGESSHLQGDRHARKDVPELRPDAAGDHSQGEPFLRPVEGDKSSDLFRRGGRDPQVLRVRTGPYPGRPGGPRSPRFRSVADRQGGSGGPEPCAGSR